VEMVINTVILLWQSRRLIGSEVENIFLTDIRNTNGTVPVYISNSPLVIDGHTVIESDGKSYIVYK
jgi:hypothetical protein